MIDIANKYEKELHDLLLDTWYEDRYKYFHNSCFSETYSNSDSNWDNHRFVSKGKDGEILGFICYEVNRSNDYVDGLAAINFSNNRGVLGRDLINVVANIFEKFAFRKLLFSVVVGNPIERSYDRLVQRYGGRIVGTYKDHCKLMDGKYYDRKLYEIFKEDYIRQIR